VARQRRGGKHRRQRRPGATLPAVGGCALALAVTGALSMPADASDAATVLAAHQAASAASSSASTTVGDGAAAAVGDGAAAAVAGAAGIARAGAGDDATMRTARQVAAAAEQTAVAASRARAERRAARAKALARSYKRPTSHYRITATFGSGGGYWSSGRHTGLDFATDAGRTVGAVAAGTVVEAGWAGAYGQQIVIKHAGGVRTSYSHLSRISVEKGDRVTPGQAIGAVGSSGNTTGPHLHLEVLKPDDTPIDPMVWLRRHGVRV
jgi:murein DD-endopeptidase MepM/ murein hydrolase activator NlpD